MACPGGYDAPRCRKTKPRRFLPCAVDTCIHTCYTRFKGCGCDMGSCSSREVIKKLEADGWRLVHVVGDHHQFKHPTKKGRVTVTHPVKDVPIGTLKSIEKQSGVCFQPQRERQ